MTGLQRMLGDDGPPGNVRNDKPMRSPVMTTRWGDRRVLPPGGQTDMAKSMNLSEFTADFAHVLRF